MTCRGENKLGRSTEAYGLAYIRLRSSSIFLKNKSDQIFYENLKKVKP